MATIYALPKEVSVPTFDWSNIPQYEKDCDKFKEDLKAYIKSMGYDEEQVGEVIHFPVADGRAEYMVASLKPVMLFHLPIGDAWHYQNAELLTKKAIIDKLTQQKALDELFKK